MRVYRLWWSNSWMGAWSLVPLRLPAGLLLFCSLLQENRRHRITPSGHTQMIQRDSEPHKAQTERNGVLPCPRKRQAHLLWLHRCHRIACWSQDNASLWNFVPPFVSPLSLIVSRQPSRQAMVPVISWIWCPVDGWNRELEHPDHQAAGKPAISTVKQPTHKPSVKHKILHTKTPPVMTTVSSEVLGELLARTKCEDYTISEKTSSWTIIYQYNLPVLCHSGHTGANWTA